MEIKHFLHKSPSKSSFTNRINNLLKEADAGGSADIIYRMWRISLLCRSDMTSKSRSGTEYLIPTDNILVFDMTNNSNLIGRL